MPLLPPPNSSWSKMFGNVSAQGAEVVLPNPPLSPSDLYYAFLSKIDLNESLSQPAYDLLFEVVASEWMSNAILASSLTVAAASPASPAILFHVQNSLEADLVGALNVENVDSIAEGSWYLMTLMATSGNPSKPTRVTGDLYDPQLDSGSGSDHGNYTLCGGATLLAIPSIGDGGAVTLVTPPTSTGKSSHLTRRLSAAFTPTGPKANIAPPSGQLPQPPAVMALGVMDVGQGNCVLITEGSTAGKSLVVDAYFDAGYPVLAYAPTAPAGLQAGGAGPINQGMASNCQIFLSHWDWDHWRLGAIFPLLGQFTWTVPVQPMGPAATNFWNALPAASRLLFQSPAAAYAEWEVYRCQPATGIATAAIMNNTGLAVALLTNNLPIAAGDMNPHAIVLTGDANFDSVPLPAYVANNIVCIVAAHHGSDEVDLMHLPVPASTTGGVTNGRIAYSYGIAANGTTHPYGFPDPDAVMAYQNSGWTNAISTAEGTQINSGGLKRGNVIIGSILPLDNAYSASAFFQINNRLS